MRGSVEGVPARIILKGVADAAGKGVTLAITILAARTLAPDAFGVMALAMTTGWLLGVATDAGLSMFLAKRVASGFSRTGNGLRALVRDVIGARAATAYAAAAIVALFSSQLVPSNWQWAFTLIVLAQVTGAVLDTLVHLFRGLQRSEIESALHLAQRTLMLVLAAAVLWWWPRLDYLGAAMLAPPLVALVAGGAIAWRITADVSSPAKVEAGPLSFRVFLRDVLPIGAGVLLSALYFRIDLFFIERWHGLDQVGTYNAVFRLVDGVRLLPAAVMAVTFPLLVQATDSRFVQRLGRRLAAGGAALAVAAIAGSSSIVTTVYGAPFASAAPAFAVLAVALPLFFLNYALTHQVIGWDGQRAYLWIAATALVANIAANLALVPSQGIFGAAIATVFTELVVTTGCVYALWSRNVVDVRRHAAV